MIIGYSRNGTQITEMDGRLTFYVTEIGKLGQAYGTTESKTWAWNVETKTTADLIVDTVVKWLNQHRPGHEMELIIEGGY